METIVQSSNYQLLTRKEAAGKLRISLITLDKLIHEQKLPAVRLGRRVLIAGDQLSAFIQKGGAK